MAVYKFFSTEVITSEPIPIFQNLPQCATSDFSPIKIIIQRNNKEFEKDIVAKDKIIFKKDQVATYEISNGEEIIINISSEDKINTALYYSLNIPMGCVFFQRGFISLHGSSISKNNKSYAFLGSPGSGKSSFVGFLGNNGFKFVSEDICIIEKTTLNCPASFPMIKLSDPAAKLCSLSNIIKEIDTDYKHRSTYSIDATTFQNEQSKLNAIYILDWGQSTRIYEPNDKTKLRLLMNFVIPSITVNSVSINKETYDYLFSLIENVPIYIFERGRDLSEEAMRKNMDHFTSKIQ